MPNQLHTIQMGKEEEIDEFCGLVERMTMQIQEARIGTSAAVQKHTTVSGLPAELEQVKAVLRASDNVDSVTTPRKLKQMVTQQPCSMNRASIATTAAEDGEEQGVMRYTPGGGNKDPARMCRTSIKTDAGRSSASAPYLGAQDTQRLNATPLKQTRRSTNAGTTERKDTGSESIPNRRRAIRWPAVDDETETVSTSAVPLHLVRALFTLS